MPFKLRISRFLILSTGCYGMKKLKKIGKKLQKPFGHSLAKKIKSEDL
jgi:hypothetical protein